MIELSVNAGSVIIAIKAVDEASGVFGKIQASLGLLGNTLQGLGSGFQQIGSVITGFAAAGPLGAAAAGIGQLVQGLQWSVDAATKAQASWTDLQSTLHLSGAAWDQAKGKIDAFVESLRTTTVFSDTQLVGALQRMATYGMNSAQAMDALRAATELAAAKHIDLETAATAIGKAFEGNTMLLKRYGVEVQTNASAHAYLKTTFDELAIAIKEASGAQLKEFGDMLASVGIQAFDAHGKMLPIKDVMTELKTAFNSGAVDGEKFAAITASLGVQFESSKAGAADFAGVLETVNKQYGGVAAAQAQTYAGAQERLANAVDAMGEKLGAILLPALANMTEAMIPIVDWLTKGIVKVQDWITAVQKMPEVKAATDAVGQAFQGLSTWLGNVGQTMMTELGPALKDLWGALKEIFVALQPLGEAFGGIWAAFTDGQGSGNALKDILWLIVQAIKDIAAVIRAVAPVIKAFAQGFKEAADFIAPAIHSMMDTIGEFVKWMHDTFDAFYNWLVGHSLWTDLWDSVVTIASTAIGKLVSDLGSSFVKPMQDAFGQIQTTFDTGLKQLPTLVDGVISLIKGDTKKGMDEVKSSVQTIFDSMPPIVQTAMTNVGTALSTGLGGLQTAVSGFATWLVGGSKWPEIFDSMEQITKEGGDKVQGRFGQAMNDLKKITESTLGDTLNTLSRKVDQMSVQVTDLSTTLQNISDNLLSKMNSMVSTFMASITQSGQVAASGSQQMTGDWQGSLSAMAALTVQAMQVLVQTVRDAVTQIITEFRRGQTETSAGIHIPVYYDNAGGGGSGGSSGGGGSSAGGSFVGAPLGGLMSQTTVPVTVNLDGRTIATAVEQRITTRIIPSERERRSFE